MERFKKFFLTERNIMMIIVINALVIFLLYFPQIELNHPIFFLILEVLDYCFVLLYILEAIVKLSVLKPSGYFSDRWNVFDFLIVIISIPSLFHFMPGLRFLDTSVMKILRLFRLIRLVRFVLFIPHLEQLIAGSIRAMKASVFVIIVLFILNFLLALFTCHFYGALLPELFGDPLISSYHIFQLFTIEGWNEIPNAIAFAAQDQDIPYVDLVVGFTRFYFVLVVLLGGIFGMSLANAIFVDEMTIDNNIILEKKIDRLQEQITHLQALIEGKNRNDP